MTSASGITWIAVALLAGGLWLTMPRRRRFRIVGPLLVTAAIITFAAQLSSWMISASWAENAMFWALTALTIAAGIGTISSRNPVYCAVWFAMTLLGTAGLMLLNGAQFLGVVTVAVYAGAILVTFLFVLMLAQPSGHAFYDRITWEPVLSSLAGAALAGVLLTIVLVAADSTVPPASNEIVDDGVFSEQHVAGLGGRLFSTYLIAVQVAGTLLLTALVAAIAIVVHGKQTSPQEEVAGHE